MSVIRQTLASTQEQHSLDVVMVKQLVIDHKPPVLAAGATRCLHDAGLRRHRPQRCLKLLHRVGGVALRRLPRRHVGLRGREEARKGFKAGHAGMREQQLLPLLQCL